jgi:hypothetical protein
MLKYNISHRCYEIWFLILRKEDKLEILEEIFRFGSNRREVSGT